MRERELEFLRTFIYIYIIYDTEGTVQKALLYDAIICGMKAQI